jgi:hypothetical protein
MIDIVILVIGIVVKTGEILHHFPSNNTSHVTAEECQIPYGKEPVPLIFAPRGLLVR